MRSIRSTLLAGAALFTLAGAAAVACGPSFPWQLLDNRTATLRDLPVDSFFFQATHLLPRPDTALHDQAPVPAGDNAPDSCTALRDPAETGANAGSDIATTLARYADGAAAFNDGDDAAAARLFRDALSSATPTAHTVCAAFMLGRTLARSGDPVGARSAFLRTRDLASHSAPDALGLAVASFGEQARLSLNESGLALDVMPGPEPVAPTPERLRAVHQAATLYAQQAAYGAEGGVASLQEMAQALFSSQPGAQRWFDAVAADPRLRQLLVAYALADTPAIEVIGAEAIQHPLLGSLDSKPVAEQLLDRLAPVFDPAADPRDAGRLAAVAYVAGRYDLAARFAAAPDDPLSAWIRARLSLQHDDLAASARAFDAAVRAAKAQPGLIGETGDRLRAEPAVIAVGQGDFGCAFRVLYGFGPVYWGDVAYLAERLLTTEELQHFVSALPPASVPPSDQLEDAPQFPWMSYERGFRGFQPVLAIRELLARRLMREGRFMDAAQRFVLPEHRTDARRYADALARSTGAFWRTERARGAWDAAVLARRSGMDLFGTEVMPDEHVVRGEYDSGYGPGRAPSGSLVTVLERQRYAASAPDPDQRFHYRIQASREAEHAASLLPARSQAYVAVMCAAARWRYDTGDAAGATRLYRQYLAHGALLPGDTLFGRSCPAPDFAAAARQRWMQPLRAVEARLERHWRGLLHRLGA